MQFPLQLEMYNDLQLVGSEKQNSDLVGYTFMHVCS